MAVCSFDWSLLFQGLKVVLDPLAAASWPIAGAAVAYWFRPDLQRLVARLRSIRGVGLEADLSVESQQSLSVVANENASTAVSVMGADIPPEHPVYTDMDKQGMDILDEHIGMDPTKRFVWLLRMRSISETNRLHEAHYRMIFGSQIQALKRLNYTGNASLEDLRAIFAAAAADPDYGHLHNGRAFESWLQFLIHAGYVTTAEANQQYIASITPLGINFLFWMVEARAVESRVG